MHDEAIEFEESARHHYRELGLTDDAVRGMIARGTLYAAAIDPNDPDAPRVRRPLPVVLMVCRLPPRALGRNLAEILMYLDGNQPTVFHVMQLSDAWEAYWRRHDGQAAKLINDR